MNLNQLNVKNALWAAAAAHEYAVVDRALAAPALGLAAVRDKGVGARQLLELGERGGGGAGDGDGDGDVADSGSSEDVGAWERQGVLAGGMMGAAGWAWQGGGPHAQRLAHFEAGARHVTTAQQVYGRLRVVGVGGRGV